MFKENPPAAFAKAENFITGLGMTMSDLEPFTWSEYKKAKSSKDPEGSKKRISSADSHGDPRDKDTTKVKKAPARASSTAVLPGSKKRARK